MTITDRVIDQAFSDLKKSCGGAGTTTSASCILSRSSASNATEQSRRSHSAEMITASTAFTSTTEKRNLYLFQFKREK